jgi:phospholipid-translocating ATPase
VCLLDLEVNLLSKILFSLMVMLSFVITILNGLKDNSVLYFTRNILLLSSIIPISLRVNLDLAKLYYAYMINHDPDIKGSIARNSNISEDLGRLNYLVTDKTGTLTKNEMVLKKLCTEFAIFESDDVNKDFEEILLENLE